MVNYLRLVRSYIVQRKIRSVLTIIGVFIGITAVFSLVSIGQGAQNYIDEQFKIAGSNRISVQPGGGGSSTSFAPGSSFVSAKLYDKDVDLISKSRGVEFAFGVILKGSIVNFKDEKKTGYILGIPTDSESISNMEKIAYVEVVDGRNLRSTDHDSVVLGYGNAVGQFKHDITVGENL